MSCSFRSEMHYSHPLQRMERKKGTGIFELLCAFYSAPSGQWLRLDLMLTRGTERFVATSLATWLCLDDGAGIVHQQLLAPPFADRHKEQLAPSSLGVGNKQKEAKSSFGPRRLRYRSDWVAFGRLWCRLRDSEWLEAIPSSVCSHCLVGILQP